jgi:small-conductance mechanosensitive channel
LEKAAYTAIALTGVYFFFEVLFEDLVTGRIKDSKTRYSLRKVISVLSIVSFIFVAISIWIVETQNILIALGLLGAAIAFALQDIFKNFMGGVMIYINGIYHVGDRVEINQAYGDVIDISVFYTTLMETRGWVDGDQATGRLTTIPNGGVLTGNVQNYTKDFDFMWDELTLPITYDSDWRSAQDKILAIVKAETAQVAENAKKIMERIEGKYYFTQRSLEPAIYVTLTDNWINFGIRYVTEVRTRRALNNRLSRLILEEFEKTPSIKIASTTMQITGFPPVQVRQEPPK